MSQEKYNVAIIGATGAVGNCMLKILEERNFPVGNLKLLASVRSVNKKLPFKGKECAVEELKGILENLPRLKNTRITSNRIAQFMRRKPFVVIDSNTNQTHIYGLEE